MSRSRALFHASLILTLLLALIACSGGEPSVGPILPRPSARPESSTTPTPAPRRGGTATIGIIGDLRQLNPAFGGPTLQSALFRPVVEGLFDFDAQGQPRPWLAESVPTRGRGVSEDGTTVIIRLRQGVAWEDGKPFSADDVIFTLAAGKNPNNPFAAEIAAAYQAIRAADALDPYTVRLTLTAPGDAYLRAFAPIFPAHLFNGVTDLVNQPYARAPFGTGPFRVADLVPGTLLTLTRSASYRLNDRPYLDRITYRAYPDVATADAALREGRIDILFSADGERLTLPQNTAILGLATVSNAPPTWNAGDWWR
ncbi:MAG TPA: ABC transporter substrate-binding protein [Thermomicrobiales bacterium]